MTAKPVTRHVPRSRDGTAPGRGLSSLAPHSLASRGALPGPKAKSATATGCDLALYVLMVLLALVGIYLFYAVIHPERF